MLSAMILKHPTHVRHQRNSTKIRNQDQKTDTSINNIKPKRRHTKSTIHKLSSAKRQKLKHKNPDKRSASFFLFFNAQGNIRRKPQRSNTQPQHRNKIHNPSHKRQLALLPPHPFFFHNNLSFRVTHSHSDTILIPHQDTLNDRLTASIHHRKLFLNTVIVDFIQYKNFKFLPITNFPTTKHHHDHQTMKNDCASPSQ